jgi:hypothetical protein
MELPLPSAPRNRRPGAAGDVGRALAHPTAPPYSGANIELVKSLGADQGKLRSAIDRSYPLEQICFGMLPKRGW